MSLAADDLLDALGTALQPPSVEPSPARLMALHRAIDERRDARVSLPARRRPWLRSPIAIAATSVAVVFGGTAAAFAAGAPIPRPVRAAVHEVGLPVDSPQLSDAKHAIADLRYALTRSDDNAIARARDQLVRRLGALTPLERRGLASVSEPLLAEANDRLGAQAPAPQTGPANTETGTAPSHESGSSNHGDNPAAGPGGSGSGNRGEGGRGAASGADQWAGSGKGGSSGPGDTSGGPGGSGEHRGSDSAGAPGSDGSAGSADNGTTASGSRAADHARGETTSPGTQSQDANSTPVLQRVDL